MSMVIPRANRVLTKNRRRSALNKVPFSFAAVGIALYGVVVLYPDIAGTLTAFTDWSGVSTDMQFIGLDNFTRLLSEPGALAALIHTLVIAFFVTFVQTLVGLLLAVALNQPLKTGGLLRGLFFLPVLLPPVVVAFLWQFLLTPTGPVNELFRVAGLEGVAHNWLADSSTALGAVIVVAIWQNVGITMVIYLAGLQAIPEELYESASMDGASAPRRFISITLPLLAPATTIVVSITLISGLKIFDQVFAMTGGGPGYATQTISVLMYKSAFVSSEYGYSNAIAFVLTILVLLLAGIQLGILRRAEVQQ